MLLRIWRLILRAPCPCYRVTPERGAITPHRDHTLVQRSLEEPLSPWPRADISRWVRRGGYSLVDQALVSITTFIAGVLLARWMTAEEYGAYAVGFSVLLIIASAQNALILEPLSVLGPSEFGERLRGYVDLNGWMSVGLSLSLSLVLVLSAVVIIGEGSELGLSLIGVGVASPCVLFYWFWRRVCYLEPRPGLAAGAGLAYCLGTIGSLGWLQASTLISPITGFLALGVGSLCGALLLAVALSPRKGQAPLLRPRLVDLARSHWRYGKWILAAGVLSWVVTSVYAPLLATVVGLESAAVFRALESLLMPLDRSLAAFALLALPALSRRRVRVGEASTIKTSARLSLLALLASAVYVCLATLLGPRLVQLVYADAFYVQYSWMLIPFGVGAMVGAAGFGFALAARAIERPRAVFAGLLLGALLVVAFAPWMVSRFGLAGAVVAQVIGTAANSIYLAVFCLGVMRKAEPFQMPIDMGSAER